jgi:hypothetical protein
LIGKKMFQMDDPSLAVLLVSGAECSSAFGP